MNKKKSLWLENNNSVYQKQYIPDQTEIKAPEETQNEPNFYLKRLFFWTGRQAFCSM